MIIIVILTIIIIIVIILIMIIMITIIIIIIIIIKIIIIIIIITIRITTHITKGSEGFVPPGASCQSSMGMCAQPTIVQEQRSVRGCVEPRMQS